MFQCIGPSELNFLDINFPGNSECICMVLCVFTHHVTLGWDMGGA